MKEAHIVIWKYKGNDLEIKTVFKTTKEMKEYLHIISTNRKKEIIEFYSLNLK